MGAITDTVPLLANLTPEQRRAITTFVTVVFDGEAVRGTVMPDDATDDQHLDLLVFLTAQFGL